MICSMLLGLSPVHKTRSPMKDGKKTESWGWGGVHPILGGTKRAADLGRNVPQTLDLGRFFFPFREWDLGPKLKIHRFSLN
jgi:hypothetical protein